METFFFGVMIFPYSLCLLLCLVSLPCLLVCVTANFSMDMTIRLGGGVSCALRLLPRNFYCYIACR
ncbi:hypothetical protein BDZ91DRAFT_744121 [Kalaharituber pfeilii]|nr:hypothetical protein BDZ91DRAFT_744121 [Kalaharituber pfeilii]